MHIPRYTYTSSIDCLHTTTDIHLYSIRVLGLRENVEQLFVAKEVETREDESLRLQVILICNNNTNHCQAADRQQASVTQTSRHFWIFSRFALAVCSASSTPAVVEDLSALGRSSVRRMISFHVLSTDVKSLYSLGSCLK